MWPYRSPTMNYMCETTGMGRKVQTSRRARRLVQVGQKAQSEGRAAAVLTLRDHAEGSRAVLMEWDDPAELGPVYAYRTDTPAERYKPRFVRGEFMLVEVDEEDRVLSRDGMVRVVRYPD